MQYECDANVQYPGTGLGRAAQHRSNCRETELNRVSNTHCTPTTPSDVVHSTSYATASMSWYRYGLGNRHCDKNQPVQAYQGTLRHGMNGWLTKILCMHGECPLEHT